MRELNPEFSVHELEDEAKGKNKRYIYIDELFRLIFYILQLGIFEMAYKAYLNDDIK